MEDINLSKLSDKELDMTLSEYKAYKLIKMKKLSVDNNHVLLIKLGDSFYFGRADSIEGNKCKFTGFLIQDYCIYKIENQALYATFTNKNCRILTDSSYLYKYINSCYRRCSDYYKHHISQIYPTLTENVQLYYTNPLSEKTRYMLTQIDTFPYDERQTLREIYEEKKRHYDNFEKQANQLLEKNRVYDNKVMIYAKDDMFNIYIPLEPFSHKVKGISVDISETYFYYRQIKGVENTNPGRLITSNTLCQEIKWTIEKLYKSIIDTYKLCNNIFNQIQV